MSILKWVISQKASLILLVFGLCITFLSIFEVKNLKQLQFAPVIPPVTIGILIGAFILLIGITMIIVDDGLGPVVLLNKTRKFESGYRASFGQAEVRILF